ncbi:dynein light chain roadblock-type 1 [Heteronotia binoei]|uniref:dynein light chain roadblock-type 1 n=1 Tax=Heteronotia binoei TaxID=13085 RepID=UPI002930DEBD|nr:dynein light chain roadblock-type 1 [Heteronotia binoei]
MHFCAQRNISLNPLLKCVIAEHYLKTNCSFHDKLAYFLPQAEVEETLKRIQSQKGVQGIIIVNSEGIPIKSTMDNSTTVQYAGLMHSLIMKARGTVRDIDPQNDLTFLRIRSKKNEIMVAPDKDYFLIVVQNPTE